MYNFIYYYFKLKPASYELKHLKPNSQSKIKVKRHNYKLSVKCNKM